MPIFSMAGEPVQTQEDWRALIGERNWQPGRSAERLANAWLAADGFPPAVSNALQRTEEFRDVRFDQGVVEHQCDLPGRGPASSTDLMVHAMCPDSRKVSIAVEGKVDEPFGELTAEWLQRGRDENAAANRVARLTGLRERFGLTQEAVEPLRYQLLHRTYAAVADAKQHGHPLAMLLIHSFHDSDPRPGWDDFARWAASLNPEGDPIEPGVPWRATDLDGIQLWLVWVSDKRV